MSLDYDLNVADQVHNVVLYDGTVYQPFLSAQAGRPIHHDAVFIRIQTAGTEHNIVDRPLEESDKRRFPLHWAHYQNQTHEGAHIGTPIGEMPGITKGAALTLKAAGFHTVEQFAAASDQVLQGVGMSAGVSPLAFRDQCKRFLNAAVDMAPTTRLEAELKQRDAAISAMQAQMDATNAALAQLMAERAAPVAVEAQRLPEPTPMEIAASVPAEKAAELIAPAAKPKLGLGSLKQGEAA